MGLLLAVIDPRPPPIYPFPVNVSLQYAQEHFADLISAADRGEEVEITRPGKPTVRLVISTVTHVRKIANRSQPARPMARSDQAPNLKTWAAMDKEIEDEMLNGPIFPDEHP